MTEQLLVADEDARFFAGHKDRQCHLRMPREGEHNMEFMTMGLHDIKRRRILVWKVPRGSPFGAGRLMRIPFLQFADETIVDDDKVLLPLLNQIMLDAAEEQGIPLPAGVPTYVH